MRCCMATPLAPYVFAPHPDFPHRLSLTRRLLTYSLRLRTGAQVRSDSVYRAGAYTFAVADTLLNIGPVGDLVMGRGSLRTVSDEDDPTASTADESGVFPARDLVTCSGQGKNGALCVLQVCWGIPVVPRVHSVSLSPSLSL